MLEAIHTIGNFSNAIGNLSSTGNFSSTIGNLSNTIGNLSRGNYVDAPRRVAIVGSVGHGAASDKDSVLVLNVL